MNEFAEKFPETGWLCPYCIQEVEEPEKAMIDRKDIPGHLVFQHGWEQGNHLTWEYIFNRLSTIGGV